MSDRIYTLNQLIDNIIRLGYGISFEVFGGQLKVVINKMYENNITSKIQQIVPLNHLENINKITNLINFMLDKLNEINTKRLNENSRSQD